VLSLGNQTHRGTAADVLNSFFMAQWKKLGWVALALCGVAVILIVVKFSRAEHSTAPANAWNSRAIESTLAGVRVRELDSTHAAVVFFYDLDNRTDTDYRLASGPNVVIMSRLQPSGSLSSDEPLSLDSVAFVPAKNRTRIALEMSHAFDWPAQRDAAAERQVRQFVADQIAGVEGFVLFDQVARYQIELAATSPEVQQATASPTPN
jgi:hypothetical protein